LGAPVTVGVPLAAAMLSNPPLLTCVAAWHEPVALHTSCPLQAFPSGHGVFTGAAGFEHAPVDGLHVPAMWH
jgi:hypothetical protein